MSRNMCKSSGLAQRVDQLLNPLLLRVHPHPVQLLPLLQQLGEEGGCQASSGGGATVSRSMMVVRTSVGLAAQTSCPLSLSR